jgi:hypothetical protein
MLKRISFSGPTIMKLFVSLNIRISILGITVLEEFNKGSAPHYCGWKERTSV